MRPRCLPDAHNWVFCEGEEQMGLHEGHYCIHCGLSMENEADILADEEDDLGEIYHDLTEGED